MASSGTNYGSTLAICCSKHELELPPIPVFRTRAPAIPLWELSVPSITHVVEERSREAALRRLTRWVLGFFSQDAAPDNPQDRPQINVTGDPSYSLHRYLNSQGHPVDELLRAPLAFRESNTENQSRDSMAAIILALVPQLPPHPN